MRLYPSVTLRGTFSRCLFLFDSDKTLQGAFSWLHSADGEGKTQRILFDFLQIGQTVSPQSIPTTSLEVKNGVNCEHSPVDLSKVSRDVEVGSQA